MKVKSSVNDYLYASDAKGSYIKISQYDILNETKTAVIGSWDGSCISRLLDVIIKMESNRGNDLTRANSNRAVRIRVSNPIRFHALQQIKLDPEGADPNDERLSNVLIMSERYNHWIDKSGWSLVEVPYTELIKDSLISAYMKHTYIACPVLQLTSLMEGFYKLRENSDQLPKHDVLVELVESCGALIVNFKTRNYTKTLP